MWIIAKAEACPAYLYSVQNGSSRRLKVQDRINLCFFATFIGNTVISGIPKQVGQKWPSPVLVFWKGKTKGVEVGGQCWKFDRVVEDCSRPNTSCCWPSDEGSSWHQRSHIDEHLIHCGRQRQKSSRKLGKAGKEFGTTIYPSPRQRKCHPGFFLAVSLDARQLVTEHSPMKQFWLQCQGIFLN